MVLTCLNLLLIIKYMTSHSIQIKLTKYKLYTVYIFFKLLHLLVEKVVVAINPKSHRVKQSET